MAEEESDGPVVPEEMEAALRESNERARALGNAFRRLGQAIQPRMEVILWISASYASSPRALSVVVRKTELKVIDNG